MLIKYLRGNECKSSTRFDIEGGPDKALALQGMEIDVEDKIYLSNFGDRSRFSSVESILVSIPSAFPIARKPTRNSITEWIMHIVDSAARTEAKIAAITAVMKLYEESQ